MPSELTTSRLDINPASHADRTRDPSLLQRFFEHYRPLTVCRGAGITSSGVEGNGIDMAREDLATIVRRSAGILDVAIDAAGATEIARRSRGTPRIANRLLRRVRDFAQVDGDGCISRELADRALLRLEVDREGFDQMDRTLLLTINDKFAGGPVGLDTLAAAIGEEKDTIEDVIEPFLIQQGFLNRTPRGRMATAAACAHLGRRPAVPAGAPLFT